MVRQPWAIKMQLRKRMHDPIAKTGAWVEQMLKGHLNYYAVSGNDPSLLKPATNLLCPGSVKTCLPFGSSHSPSADFAKVRT
jgi:hypothetical protein